MSKNLNAVKAQLQSQEEELDSTRSKVQRLNSQHEGQVKLLETTKAAYDKTISELNDLLIQKENLTHEVGRGAARRLLLSFFLFFF